MPIQPFLIRGCLAASLLLCAIGTQAQYLWIQPSQVPNQARVLAGALPKPLSKLPALQQAKAIDQNKAGLPLKPMDDAFTIDQIPTANDVRFTAIEPLADGIVYYHHSKWGRNTTEPINDLELVPIQAGGNTFKLIWKGSPVTASLVNVDTSAGWRRQLTPNQDGSITLPTPFPGLYVLEITVRINDGSVTLNGKKYSDVRHNATLSFEVAP